LKSCGVKTRFDISQGLFVRHIDTWGGKPRSIPEVSGGENRLDG